MGGVDATRRIARRAARQHGNVTYAEMLEDRLSRAQIEDRIEEGWYAALSHRSAGAHWELRNGAVPFEVTVPTTGGRYKRDGILVHRAALPEGQVETRNRIRVTSLVRTLCDLAAVEKLARLSESFEQAQVKHHLKPDLLAAEVIARRGYRGNANLRLILEDAVDPAAVRSILELRFLKLCAAHGIPRPMVNVELGPWIVDFFWPEQALVVETDGYAFHRTVAARRKDALRDEHLRGVGLVVVRLTWGDVTEQPAATAARVLDSLRDAVSGVSSSE